jgi:hypothetical protein
MATIIIHDIFRTDDVDSNKVKSSSYLDLGPLYGHDQKMQDTVRAFKDGKLKPDTFPEPRILGQPPGVGALLISFGRFHNYIVGQLALINENGRFNGMTDYAKAKGMSEEAVMKKRDEDLFQTGRLITCGLYINIVLRDYVRVILNLNRTETAWTLDPRTDEFNPFDKEGTPKGIGNQVSMEFNLIYRRVPPQLCPRFSRTDIYLIPDGTRPSPTRTSNGPITSSRRSFLAKIRLPSLKQSLWRDSKPGATHLISILRSGHLAVFNATPKVLSMMELWLRFSHRPRKTSPVPSVHAMYQWLCEQLRFSASIKVVSGELRA